MATPPNQDSIKNWFLTGSPGIGKTTVVHELVHQLKDRNYLAGGILSPEIREEGKRSGFVIRDIMTGREETMAHKDSESTMLVGSYKVLAQNVDAVCGEAFPYAFQHADVILVDEVGPMELFSQGFKHFMKQTLKQPQPLVAVIHPKAKRGFVQNLLRAPNSASYTVTTENRDTLPDQLFDQIKKII